MVADYAITHLGEPEDTWEESASFEVNVLAPERTLLEKIAAVHDAAVRNTETLLKHGRHFYDIDRLLNTASVVQALTRLGAPTARMSSFATLLPARATALVTVSSRPRDRTSFPSSVSSKDWMNRGMFQATGVSAGGRRTPG